MAVSDKRYAQFIKEIDGVTYLLLPFSELNRVYNSDHTKDLETILSEIESKLSINLTNAEKRIDVISKILASEGYSDIEVSKLTMNGSERSSITFEVGVSGSTVSDITVGWTIDGTPLSISLNGTDVDKTATSLVLSPAMNMDAIGRKQFNLVITGSIGTVTKTLSVYVLNNFYYGIADAQDTYDGTFLSKLTAVKPTTFYTNGWSTYTVPTINAGAGKYIFIAIPKSLIRNNILFNIGGFDDNWTDQHTITVTNGSGATMEYVLFKSGQAGLGSTSIIMKNNQ